MLSRVVHFGKYPLGSRGGIERVLDDISVYGAKLEHDFVTYSKSEVQLHRTETTFLINLYLLGQPFSVGYTLKLLSSIFKSRTLVLHFPNLNIFCCLPLLFFCRRFSVFWHADPLKKEITSTPINVVVGFVTWCLLCRASVIFVTSPQYRDVSPFLRYLKKKCSVVPIGVRCDGVIHNGPKRGEKNQARIVRLLFVGRLVKYKGVGDLIRAMALLPTDMRLEIIGDGPEFSNLSKINYQLGTHDRVSFRGAVNNSELKKSYRESDIFVLPSIDRAEAYGIVLLEAMAQGLPFIIRPVFGSGMRFIQNSSLGNYCCDGMKVEDLAMKILEVADRVKKYGEGLTLGARLKNHEVLLKEFSCERFVETFEQRLIDNNIVC